MYIFLIIIGIMFFTGAYLSYSAETFKKFILGNGILIIGLLSAILYLFFSSDPYPTITAEQLLFFKQVLIIAKIIFLILFISVGIIYASYQIYEGIKDKEKIRILIAIVCIGITISFLFLIYLPFFYKLS